MFTFCLNICRIPNEVAKNFEAFYEINLVVSLLQNSFQPRLAFAIIRS